MYIASTIPSAAKISEQLKENSYRLYLSRLNYNDNDIKIKNILEERIFLIDMLKRESNGFLIAKKAESQARLKAAERPKGVLIKYRMLLSKASRDKATLDDLEDQYRVLLLEKARNEDPWKLITTPTLLPDPVAPNVSKAILLGLLSGIFTGICAAILAEKRKNIIFSSNLMESIGDWPILAELNSKQKKSFEESIDLLTSGPLLNENETISFLIVGTIEDSKLNQLNESIKKFLKNRTFIISKDIRESIKSSSLVVVSAIGITKYQELIDIKKKLLVINKPVLGLLVLNDYD